MSYTVQAAEPDASATKRGVVTTGPQTFAGDKTFSGKVSISAAGGSNFGVFLTGPDGNTVSIESAAGLGFGFMFNNNVKTLQAFTSGAISGANAFRAPNAGARWSIGGGTLDYLFSDGSGKITAAGNFAVGSGVTFTGSSGDGNFGGSVLVTGNVSVAQSSKVLLDGNGGSHWIDYNGTDMRFVLANAPYLTINNSTGLLSTPYAASFGGTLTFPNDIGIRGTSVTDEIRSDTTGFYISNGSGNRGIRPASNGGGTLGASNARWGSLYATSGFFIGDSARAAISVAVQSSQPTGPNAVGDMYVATGGVLKICTVAGSPGTWVSVGAQT